MSIQQIAISEVSGESDFIHFLGFDSIGETFQRYDDDKFDIDSMLYPNGGQEQEELV